MLGGRLYSLALIMEKERIALQALALTLQEGLSGFDYEFISHSSAFSNQ